MTEQEWLASGDLDRMLDFVSPSFTVHKAVAFAAACATLVNFHPGPLTARFAAAEADDPDHDGPVAEEWAPDYLIASLLHEALRFVAIGRPGQPLTARQHADRLRSVCGLLRELFNPFHIGVDAAWQTTTVVRLAQAIYDGATFEHLPILADALEEAGCTDAAVLRHCRGPGPHVRGCWVVDRLLGKK
jgi:hypothetical protein